MSSLKNENNKGYEEQRNVEAWRRLNKDLFKEEKKWQYEVAEMMGVRESVLSTMLGGGEDRLSFDNVENLLRRHIRLGGLSPARLHEWLDRLNLCPGWKHADKEDQLREVAEEEFREKGIITVNAVTASVNDLNNKVRALSKRDFALLKAELWNGKFHELLKLFESWRKE